MNLIARDRPTLNFKDYLAMFSISVKEEQIEKLEEQFAKYIGADYCIVFSSARIALYSMYSLFASGGEVIVPAFGCMPVADSVNWANCRPRFVDIDLETYNIDPTLVKKAINRKTRIISPVHLYGLSCDLDPLIKFRDKNNLLLIEDAAMAPGAEYPGKRVGTFGDLAVFSLERSKVLTSYHGGLVTTNNKKLYSALLDFRSDFKRVALYGLKQMLQLLAYDFVLSPSVWGLLYSGWSKRHVGGTTNLGIYEKSKEDYAVQYSARQANLALNQLSRLDEFIDKRRNCSNYFNNELRGIKGLVIPSEPSNYKHVYARYILRCEKDCKLNRDHLKQELIKYGIDASYWYCYSLPYTDFYKKYGDKCPNAKKAAEQTLALPNYPSLTKKEVELIAGSVRACLK